MIISASEESALCDKHHTAMAIRKSQMDSKNCSECFSASSDFDECSKHKILEEEENCQKCMDLKKLVTNFQTHKHTFTCQKKNKLLTVKKNEGHGRNDGIMEGPKISNYVHCRFNFPQFPMNKTTFILGMSKSLDENEKLQRRKDLLKIKKFLIRQTYSENGSFQECSNFKDLTNLTFMQFLFEVGMFETDKKLKQCSKNEKAKAYERYINAISASIRGTGSIFLKRKMKDLFTNNFNRRLMEVHKANHDIQIVVDQVKQIMYIFCNAISTFIFSMPVHSM